MAAHDRSDAEDRDAKAPVRKEPVARDSAITNPADALTKQRQPKDAGPLSKERDVGQFGGRGRPPLQKK